MLTHATFTRFAIEESAYPGEFFILCDDSHETWQQLEDIKAQIRAARPPELQKYQRYTGNEVHTFVMLSVGSHFHGLRPVLC